jgi:hypothetical protein
MFGLVGHDPAVEVFAIYEERLANLLPDDWNFTGVDQGTEFICRDTQVSGCC